MGRHRYPIHEQRCVRSQPILDANDTEVIPLRPAALHSEAAHSAWSDFLPKTAQSLVEKGTTAARTLGKKAQEHLDEVSPRSGPAKPSEAEQEELECKRWRELW